jgi:predicted phage tail component-like protein
MNPISKDVTVEVPGGDGQYYFGTFHTNTQFTIKFAFEELDEEGFLLLKQVYQNKQISDLIFDETPYKVYSAKVTGDNSLNYIPFSINGKRVYRGEGTLQFTCYYPYAHTPNRNTK